MSQCDDPSRLTPKARNFNQEEMKPESGRKDSESSFSKELENYQMRQDNTRKQSVPKIESKFKRDTLETVYLKIL